MSTPDFRFRQFTVRHDRCAMKVGTDGVLLGAWAWLPSCGRLLDIGTGTGLIALMMAQRCPDGQVTAIDIDADAVCQARENVAASPFAQRINVLHTSLQQFKADAQSGHEPPFDAILCNPPFFEENLLPPDTRRSAARHTMSLPFQELAVGAATLLGSGGRFSTVLPTTAFEDFRLLCFGAGLTLRRLCHVQTVPTKPPKRVLATFAKGNEADLEETTLILQNGTARSEAYAALTHDFYLW